MGGGLSGALSLESSSNLGLGGIFFVGFEFRVFFKLRLVR